MTALKLAIYIFAVIGFIAVLAAIAVGPRHVKDIEKKRNYANTYAIENAESGKCLRVYNASNADGAPIILYNHHNWECMTWQLIEVGENTYLLKNLYTQKGFEPQSAAAPGVAVWQQTLGGERQMWVVEKTGDNCTIRLRGTDLYLTATSVENNSEIILKPRDGSEMQQWSLIRQNPIV